MNTVRRAYGFLSDCSLVAGVFALGCQLGYWCREFVTLLIVRGWPV